VQPAFQLDERNHREWPELLRELDGRAHVVRVAVSDRDHVHALRFLLRVRTLRVVEPRIDVDSLPTRRIQSERRVAKPGQRRVSHRSPFGRPCGPNLTKERPRGGGTFAGMAPRTLPALLALCALVAD